MKLLIYGILAAALYRLVFQPAKEGYEEKPRTRIIKKKKKPSITQEEDYTDYEEID